MKARMRKNVLVALPLLTALAGCGVTDISSEDVGNAKNAVTNGTVVSNPAGFEKAIVILQNPSGGSCTATVIRKRWVLTARHCVQAAGGSVMAGNFTIIHKTLAPSGILVSSGNVSLHPDPIIDSALLYLPVNLDVGGDVSLFSGQDQDVPANIVTYGFSPFSPSGPLATPLSKASLPAHVARNAEMQNYTLYDNKYLVMGTNGSQGIGPGDSGGPSFVGSSLIATTGGANATAYAKAFRKWVLDKVATTHPNPAMQIGLIQNSFGVGGEWPMPGDVNGDGRADLINFVRDSVTGDRARDVEVSLATASGTYLAATRWHGDFASNYEIPLIGDFDGNGTADIAKFDTDSSLDVAMSAGTPAGSPGFYGTERWYTGTPSSGEVPAVGDFNGDAFADIAIFKNGNVYVQYSCGQASSQATLPAGCSTTRTFGARQLLNSTFKSSLDVGAVGDFNGDGIVDLLRITPDGGAWVALTARQACNSGSDCGPQSTACWTDKHVCPADLTGETSNGSALWAASSHFQSGDQLKVADVNGDGKDDLVIFHANAAHGLNGEVEYALSNGTNGFGGAQVWAFAFCWAGQLCDVGDSNGDGRSDAFMFVRSSSPPPSEGNVMLGLSK